MLSLQKSGLVLAAMAFFCSSLSFAADIENGVVMRLSAEEQKPLVVGGKEIQIKNFDISAKVKRDANGVALAPAAGISYFEIQRIYSSGAVDEYPAYYQTATTYDHGNDALYIFVLQYGYGNPNMASMNGISKRPAISRELCGPATSLHFCGVGETITGWYYGFDFTGQKNGNFTTSANSTAFPFGYWKDSIYIR